MAERELIEYPGPWDGDILAQDLIELIEYPYQQGASSFSEAYLERTSKLSLLGLEQFGMGDRPEVFSGAHEWGQMRKRLVLVCGDDIWS
jgi:hypothetical protein